MERDYMFEPARRDVSGLVFVNGNLARLGMEEAVGYQNVANRQHANNPFPNSLLTNEDRANFVRTLERRYCRPQGPPIANRNRMFPVQSGPRLWTVLSKYGC